jgi:hypothetical protein
MVHANLPHPATDVRARPIAPADHTAVAELLNKGFGLRRGAAFWRHVLDRLHRRSLPADLPNYGYLLESGRRPVGVILLIAAMPRTGAGPEAMRCNVSSWYVEPAFRGYASFLTSRALHCKTATYLNVSPAPNTEPILEAQGWMRYSDGLFIAAPALQRRAAGGVVARLMPADRVPPAPCEDFERDLLARHAGYGCLAFWCATAQRAYPFVFRRRFARGIMPCAQLIYCREVADVARFAGLIGRHLLMRGCPLVVIDAKGRVPGLVGRYVGGLLPKYFKGGAPPRLGDLADTEAAMFGV